MAEKLPAGQSSGQVGGNPGLSGNVLTVVITGTIKGLQTAYTQAAALTSKFSHTVKGAAENVEGPLDKVGEAFKEWIVPIAAAATAFYGFHEVMEAFKRADNLGKTAEGLGITTDALQKMEFAAQQSGASSEAMDKALQNMSRFLQSATDDGSAAAKQLQEMGLSAKEFIGLSADEAFAKMADGLKSLESQGKRATISQAAFGREARNLGELIGEGSEGIKAMGESAEKMGRVISSLDLAKMKETQNSMERLHSAIETVTARLATALAPAIEWIADGVNEWIGNTEQFNSTFKTTAEGVVGAVGIMKTVWQGLEVLWETGKVAIGALSVAMWETARGITKAVEFIWGEMKNWYDASVAGMQLLGSSIVYVWEFVKTSALKAFAYIEASFGETLRSIGQAARESEIEGLSELGAKVEEAGADLIVGAEHVKGAANKDMKEAATAVSKAADNNIAALKKFGEMPDVSTPWLDHMVENAKKYTGEAVDSLKDISYEIASQKNGNAVDEMYANFAKAAKHYESQATKIAKEYSEKRAVVTAEEMDKRALYLKGASKRQEDYAFGLWKTEVDASEKIKNVWMNQDALNKSLIAGQLASYQDFLATKEARSADFHLNIHKQAEQATEELANLQSRSNDDWAAMQSKFNDDMLSKEQRAADANRMLWENSLNGKLEVADQILSSLAVLMESKNKHMFQIGKIAAISDAIIQTWLGAQKAYTAMAGIPVVGPSLGIAAAAAAVLGGMVRVQQIQSTSFGGGSVGGAAAGGGQSAAGAASAGAQATQQQNMNVTLYGDSFSGTQVRALVSSINDAAGDNMNIKTQVAR